MKISCLGADENSLCQIPTLRAGFGELGHVHIPNPYDPDVAFAFIGNAPFDSYLELSQYKKTIFNVLDLCPHCREHNEIVERLKVQLPKAHRVTTISKTVARQLKDLCGVDAEVIYYPMKPVHYTGKRKYPQFRAMMLGRLCDPNKRARLAMMNLVRAGFQEHEVVVVGPEDIGYGTYIGTVGDDVLNDLYNSVDYVLMFGREEGIGLPAIEAACCGAISLVLPDLSTFDEFWAESPLGLHYQSFYSPTKIAELILAIEQNPEWKAQIKQDMLAYATLAFRPKFEAKAVANRIIEIFHTL